MKKAVKEIVIQKERNIYLPPAQTEFYTTNFAIDNDLPMPEKTLDCGFDIAIGEYAITQLDC